MCKCKKEDEKIVDLKPLVEVLRMSDEDFEQFLQENYQEETKEKAE